MAKWMLLSVTLEAATMARANPPSTSPEPYRAPRPGEYGPSDDTDFHVSEFACDFAGAMSPFGDEVQFPLPVAQLRYAHPARSARPNLAGGR
jgi:hypothetical protein